MIHHLKLSQIISVEINCICIPKSPTFLNRILSHILKYKRKWKARNLIPWCLSLISSVIFVKFPLDDCDFGRISGVYFKKILMSCINKPDFKFFFKKKNLVTQEMKNPNAKVFSTTLFPFHFNAQETSKLFISTWIQEEIYFQKLKIIFLATPF